MLFRSKRTPRSEDLLLFLETSISCKNTFIYLLVRLLTTSALSVAGTSCVDYSPLNRHGKGIDDGGESGDTFAGMLAYVVKHRPVIVILENVCKAPWKDVEARFSAVGFDALALRLDTKCVVLAM